MSPRDCCCEKVDELEDLERRAGELVAGYRRELERDSWKPALLRFMDLDEYLPRAEALLEEAGQIVAELVVCCEDEPPPPPDPNGPPDESEIKVSSKDHSAIFSYPLTGDEAPDVRFRPCGVAIYGKEDIPVHDTPFDNDHDGELDHSQGVQWVVAEVAPRRWLACSFEWSRPVDEGGHPTHDWKSLHCEDKFGGDFVAALIAHCKDRGFDEWQPRAGDLLGWFRSSNARFGSQRYVPAGERVRQPIAWHEIPAEWI
jgi:hypothetical protein